MILFSPQKPTAKSFAEQAQTRFSDQSKQFLKLYPAETDAEALQSAIALASDDFIAFSTWKWIDTQSKTGVPVYEYHFEQVPKTKPGAMMGPIPASEMGSTRRRNRVRIWDPEVARRSALDRGRFHGV